MEQKMTVKDAIFSFKQWIGFTLNDDIRSLEEIARDVKNYADFLYGLSVLDDENQMIVIHENPMGGFYCTKDEDEYEGEI